MVFIGPSVVRGRLRPPPSKSYSHRTLTVALISEGRSSLRNVSLARDVRATLDAVRMMGASIQPSSDVDYAGGVDMTVEPPETPITPDDVVQCGGSGTTIRFFSAVATLTPAGYTVLTGNESLRRRPMGPLIDAINALGGWAVSSRGNGLPPLIVRGGGLRGGEATLPGDMSSQFFSALMIAGTMSRLGVRLKHQGRLVSKPYLEMTSHILRAAGSDVSLDRIISVRPLRPRGLNLTIPGDFGLAAPLMAMASLTGGWLEIEGLEKDMPQADGLIVDVLRSFGVQVRWRGDTLEVRGRPDRPARLDLRDAPDLLPVAAVMAVFVRGTSELRGVKHARYKESDRIANMRMELERLGVEVRELDDGLVVEGEGGVRRCERLNSHRDHRIFMALVALAAASESGCEVTGEEWVSDSYPNFLRDARKLGLVVR